MERRKFIKLSLLTGATTLLPGAAASLFSQSAPEAVWVEDAEPPALLHSALQAFGGMKSFISKGDVVAVKPNIGWDRAPQFAANTNPELVAEVVKACYEAGAKEVKVFDRTCNNPQRCYHNSGIAAEVEKYDGQMKQVRDHHFKTTALPKGQILKEWPLYREYLESDKQINIPIAKHHAMARVTLSLKNLMGIMGGNRGNLHNGFEKKIIDIDQHILPTLTIIDAFRILRRNGPVGGNLNDVEMPRTLIMSRCAVSADMLGLRLFGLEVADVPYLEEAYRRGLNQYDPLKINLQKINLS
ncbi:MAG: DUF362 domain-containing protein [Calditrichia bacterium]